MRGVVILAAALGAVTGAFGAMSQSRSDPATQAELVERIRSDAAPGTIVRAHGDGSVSFLGGYLGGATPEAQAEHERMNEAADAGPNTIRCAGGGVSLACNAVPDPEVIPALRRGESAMYGRTVYGFITPAGIGRPLFESGELVCGRPADNGAMACSRVDDVKPTIRPSETVFVTYKSYEGVSFRAGGGVIGPMIGAPTIPLTFLSD